MKENKFVFYYHHLNRVCTETFRTLFHLVQILYVHLQKRTIMETKERQSSKARFDTRISPEQKLTFQKAAILGGYRNLSEFIVSAAQEKAKQIIKEYEKILASERDSEIFFDAIIKAVKPNDELISAAKLYKDLLSE